MIFTDQFVYIHEPKTGGTFVTTALLRVHGVKWSRLTHLASTIKIELVYQTPYGTFVYHNNKHGTCSQIPAAHQHKSVLATVRNPYDVLVSQYEFGWWKRREFLRYYRAVPDFEKEYANFPDLNFDQYLSLANRAFRQNGSASDTQHGVGLMTEQFVKYYFKNPPETLARINRQFISDEHRFALKDYVKEMFDVDFIRTHKLNRELYEYLLGKTYKEQDVKFILDSERILPMGKGRSAEQKWEHYYTAELKRFVRERERLIFDFFPEFDL